MATNGGSASDYREFAPPPSLANYLLCTWQQSTSAKTVPHHHLVLPDGCIDIVWVHDRPPFIAGPATRPEIATLPERSLIFGARLRPGLAPSLLGVPADELLNLDVPLSQVSPHLANGLHEAVTEERSIAGRLQAIERLLTAGLPQAKPADVLVLAAIRWLANHPDGSVDQLSRSLGISSRQLHRRFCTAVGYGPKTLQGILRFQRLLTLAHTQPRSLLDLALEAGYADQPHMTREVTRLAGRTPSALLARAESALIMSDLFKTEAFALD